MTTDLEDHSTLKDDQHECGEQRIIPILVQAPQSDAEHLEDEERRDGVLSEQFGEFGDGNVTLIDAVSRLEGVEGG